MPGSAAYARAPAPANQTEASPRPYLNAATFLENNGPDGRLPGYPCPVPIPRRSDAAGRPGVVRAAGGIGA
jgi:hypothetical protein